MLQRKYHNAASRKKRLFSTAWRYRWVCRSWFWEVVAMVHHDQFTLRADHEALMFNPVSLSQQLLNIGLSCIAPVQVNQVLDESLLQIFLIMLQLTLSRLD
jgi:hypothetical protein